MGGWVVRIGLVLVVMVGATACGSSDDGDGSDAGTGTNESSGGESADQEAGSGDAAVPVGEAPEIDPATMPAAGEARVEVAGQTFVFRQADMLEGVFTCEVRDDGITINFQSDRHDLLLQGAVQADGTILASTVVSPEEWDFRYDSTNVGGNGGGVAVDGKQVLYAGRFDETDKLDLADFSGVGAGTVAVTCP